MTDKVTSSIILEELSCRYSLNSSDVFSKINLKIEHGDIIAVLGENGSGKTTLGLCIGGIIPHLINAKVRGNVIIKGKDVKNNDFASIADDIGYVFQNPENQFLGLTVEDEVLMDLVNRGKTQSEAKKQALDTCNLLRVTPLFEKYVHNLSLGQKQRVALASLLSRTSSILILDQPFSNLDPVGKMQLRDHLATIHKEKGATIILLTPDPRDLEGLNVETYLFENGNLIKKKPVYSQTTPFAEEGSRAIKPSHSSEDLIAMENVSYRYTGSRSWAVEGLNIRIGKGESVGIVGLNGSGKSTLLYLLAGLMMPQIGKYSLAGEDAKRMGFTELAQHVALIFQNPDHQLFNNTIRDELQFGLKKLQLNDHEISKRVETVRSLLPTDELKRDPRALSFGQKKLVTLASALVMDSQCYLMDEPELGLDATFQWHFEQIIEELLRREKTLVIASHDLDMICRLTERVILIDDGKVVRGGDKSSMVPFISDYFVERYKSSQKVEIQ